MGGHVPPRGLTYAQRGGGVDAEAYSRCVHSFCFCCLLGFIGFDLFYPIQQCCSVPLTCILPLLHFRTPALPHPHSQTRPTIYEDPEQNGPSSKGRITTMTTCLQCWHACISCTEHCPPPPPPTHPPTHPPTTTPTTTTITYTLSCCGCGCMLSVYTQ